MISAGVRSIYSDIPSDWRVAPLRTVLRLVRKPVEVEPDTLYREIGIYSHGKGIFHKEKRTGASLGNKRVFWVEPDCFVVNIVFAWEGAVAKTTTDERGMISSHRFPMYRPKRGILDLDYVTYYFNSLQGRYLLGLASPGGAGWNRTLGQQSFLNLSVPLPPYPEQRMIANILSTCDRTIELMDRRIEAAQQRKKAFLQQLLSGQQRFPEFRSERWAETRIGDIARVNPPKPRHLSDDALVSFIAMSDVSESGRVINMVDRPFRDVYSGYTPFQDGDILVAKITPCFENGKGALLSNLRNGCGFGSTEFHVIRADDPRVLSRFIYYHTLTHDFRGAGEVRMVGSAGQKRVRTDFVRNYRIVLPSVNEQRRIVTVLQACDHEIDLLARKLEALLRQKRGLMQRLLTGRMRAKV
jgi:type I restriction enzyme S subunit